MDVNEMILKLIKDGVSYVQAVKDVQAFEMDMKDIETEFLRMEGEVNA